MSTLLHDIRFAFRQLLKKPGFTAVIVMILALGMGGVTAMFSTLYTVMLQPLPYAKPDRLVLGRATVQGNVNPWASGPDYADYRDKNRSFSSLEAFFCNPMEVTVTGGQGAERANMLLASAGVFQTLGVNMSLGRPFTAEEGKDGAPPVAIVSHAYWQKHLAAQKDLAGRSLVMDGLSYEIVGVTPKHFNFIQDVDLWIPMHPQNLGPRRYNNWYMLGRLKDGVTLQEAQSDVDVIAAQLGRAYPDTDKDKALLLTPLQGAFTEQYRSSFGLLGGGALAILLIAWANAAGLLLARGSQRQGELAVRTALGASRWSLTRLLMTEALILAGMGGILGTLLAVWMQKGLLLLMPVETLLLRGIGLSLPVLLFTLAMTILTGFGFGLLPAWRAKQTNLTQDLRSSGRGALRKGVHVRRGLVAGQVMVSFVLLVVAGLLFRSLTLLHHSNPGFNTRNLLTVEVPLPPTAYKDPQRLTFFTEFQDRVKSLPGVSSAGLISQLPLRNPFNNIGIYATFAPPANPQDGGDGYQRVVLPGYFKTMDIPLLSGRDIQSTDTPDSRRAVILSQRLAKQLFPDRNPLGQQVVIDRNIQETPWEVVGVVGDVKQDDLRQVDASRGTFYRAYGQVTPSTMRLAVRTRGNPAAIVSSLRALLQNLDREVPLSGPRTMEDILENSTISERAMAACLTMFSLLAVVLAAVGIYGLLAYVVAQRTRDIGIRMALGATRWNVAWPILREAAFLATTGLVAGGVLAFAATRLIQANLYGVQSGDPLTITFSALVLMGMASLAAWFPAWRAARVEPMTALKCE